MKSFCRIFNAAKFKFVAQKVNNEINNNLQGNPVNPVTKGPQKYKNLAILAAEPHLSFFFKEEND